MLKIIGLGLLWLVAVVAMLVVALAAFQQGTSFEVLVGFSGKPLWWVGFLALIFSFGIALLSRLLHRKRMALFIAIASIGLGLALWFNSRYAIPDKTVSYVSHGVMLEADLYLSDSANEATVIIVHGSADFPRSFYQYWASNLRAMGLNVLLADKRGVGGSGGVFVDDNNGSAANLQLLADDVLAAVEYVASNDQIQTSKIGLFGLSQAGWTAPMAADSDPRIEFMILVTAPTVSIYEESVWSDLRGDDEQVAQVSFEEADRVMQSTEPAGVDARESLAQLDIPVLWLFGEVDNSIPTSKSVEVLVGFKAQGKSFDYMIYPGFSHVLMQNLNGGRPTMNQLVWSDIELWLVQRAIVSELHGKA